MNTSRRTQRPILMVLAAVLALVLTVSAMGITVFADGTTAAPTNVKVSLDGQVNLMFKFAEPAASYTATVGNREITDLTADDNGWVSVPLYPYEMAETVTLTAAGADTGIKFSVVAYANKVLAAKEATAGDHDKIRALLNYGAMTQTDRGHNTDNLANKDIFTKNNPKDAVTSITQDGVAGATGDTTDISGTISLVVDDGDIALKYTVTHANADATLTATIVGAEAPVTLKNNGDNTYSLTISDIGANSFDKIWDVTISDGTKSVNSKHSVLEYLGYRLTNGTDTQKDVCRALYQLYQHATNALPTDCEHGVANYEIVTTSKVTYAKCSVCSGIVKTILTPEWMMTKQSSDNGTPSRREDFGTMYWRCEPTSSTITNPHVLNYIWTRETYQKRVDGVNVDTDWAEGTGTGMFDVGQATYMVVKAKFSDISKATLRFEISSKGCNSSTDDGGVGANYVVSRLNNTVTKADTWQTFKIDLSTLKTQLGDRNVWAKDSTTGSYIVDTLMLSIGSTGATDIAYIAFVENADDADDIIITNNCRHTDGTNPSSENGINYTRCKTCGAIMNTVLTPEWLISAYQGTPTGTPSTGEDTDGTNYWRLTKGSSGWEHIWTREQTSIVNGWKEGTGTGMFDVGKATYIVIRARVNDADANVSFQISSKGCNIDDIANASSSAKAVVGRLAANSNNSSNGQNNLTAGTWTTFYYDLTKIYTDGTKGDTTAVWKKDAGENSYVVDSFVFAGGSSTTTDIAYIAFVNDKAAAQALVDADNAAE